MKRLLLISDTHGRLDVVDELAARERADAVIHAGDFGFYDDECVDRLEARELFLRVVHSDLPPEEKARAKKLSGHKLRDFVRARLPLGDLGRWLREGRGFRVPTFAVWGNHEDRVVVEDLLAGRARVPNLTLISERASYEVGRFRIFGLGGNLIVPRLGSAAEGLAGEGGKIWTTRAQIERLLEAAAPRAHGEIRIWKGISSSIGSGIVDDDRRPVRGLEPADRRGVVDGLVPAALVDPRQRHDLESVRREVGRLDLLPAPILRLRATAGDPHGYGVGPFPPGPRDREDEEV